MSMREKERKNEPVKPESLPKEAKRSLRKYSQHVKMYDRMVAERKAQLSQDVINYHENLLKQAPGLSDPLTGEMVLAYIQENINQSELKQQIKQVLEMRQRQNIEGDLMRSNEYINELLEYLLQFEAIQGEPNAAELLEQINGGVNFLAAFLTQLTKPVRRDFIDELRRLQTQDPGSYAHFESTLDPLKNPILPVDMYLDVEKSRQFTYPVKEPARELARAYDSANSAFSQISALSATVGQEAVHILNKCLFDAMNESLSKFRPYGMVGEPVPWSNSYRRLQTEVDISSVDTERLFQMVKQEVYRWMSAQQGALQLTQKDIFAFIDL
jgi:hypothetical protein